MEPDQAEEEQPGIFFRIGQSVSWQIVSIFVGLIGGGIWFMIEQPFKDRAAAREMADKIEVALVKDARGLSESELTMLEDEASRISLVLVRNSREMVEIAPEVREQLEIKAEHILYDPMSEQFRAASVVKMSEFKPPSSPDADGAKEPDKPQ